VTRSDRPAAPTAESSTPARSWVELAGCRELDPDIFFPVGTTAAEVDQTGEARAICARCQVTADCLGWALRTGQDHGVWGGTTPEERRDRRRAERRRRIAASTETES
jgi:WhiB family transcriptional regulator, redox-sensing transcriptional regulator